MQQYFYDDSLELGQEIHLSKDDNHHIVRVMRGEMGLKMQIVDINGQRFIGQITSINDHKALLKILTLDSSINSELPVNVTIACGLSKNDKLDWILQKVIECGANQFIPLTLTRDVVKWNDNKASKRIERLEKIAKKAAEQSHRLVIPKVGPLMTLTELIQEHTDCDHKLVAYEEIAKVGGDRAFKETLNQFKKQDEIIMVFGSEGGFDPYEIALLETNNYIKCSLGPRILRAETAPIYALSAISYQLEL